MTVSREQAQMLTALAIACRPHRAPTWDAPGVMEAIGKVRNRSLPEVCLAVIRAAADREAVTPGVIPSNGSHWQEQLKPPKWQPETIPPADRCSVCSKHRDRCQRERIADDDHAFTPAHVDRRRPADTITQIVAATKAELQPTRPRPEPAERAPSTDERIAEVRAALTTGASE